MIELRWKVEEWEEYRGGLSTAVKHTEPSVLQYRQMENPEEIGLHPPIWTEWVDVPTEYIET